MTDDEKQIAWPALEEGTPVYSADGADLGTVADVVADRQKDIFSGIVIDSGRLRGKLFVPATSVAEMSRAGVKLTLTADAVERELSPPE